MGGRFHNDWKFVFPAKQFFYLFPNFFKDFRNDFSHITDCTYAGSFLHET